MDIIWHKSSGQFHLFNDKISYIFAVSPSGELTGIYFGKRIHDKADMSYVQIRVGMPQMAVDPDTESYCMEINRQEYPSFGTTDLGTPAFEIEQANGSKVTSFVYKNHKIIKGKNGITGLPATYADKKEALTIEVELVDSVAEMTLILSYTIFESYAAVVRHAKFVNNGNSTVRLTRALSCCLDLADQNYDWMQFSGAWARERIPEVKHISTGTVMIESKRGISSANQNPFVIVKRPGTDEFYGEAFGFSFVYSGNFVALAEGNNHDRLRIMMGINPVHFAWPLEKDQSFETPEVVMAFTADGLNALSQTYHHLFNNNLVRGKWKNRPRPILNNNWEATFMDFTEEKILKLAKKAKEAGVELFVLDDGWFGERNDDTSSLGDWVENKEKLPEGIKGLASKINALGLDFGFWIEPEMVNINSNLYRKHPDWILSVPGRKPSLGRHQLVLDFTRPEVVDAVYDMLFKVLDGTHVRYIKWDMNRTLTEVYSCAASPEMQGTVYHKYIMGVYSLYERLIAAFPEILFESCSSGGSRFDAGMLYYAPQAWCSDNTDAIDRIGIQYGSSYGYPLVSIGAHVSAVPNQQTGRSVSIKTRANVAYFGTFGYELDLNELSDSEFQEVKKQVAFMKENRELLQFGNFYRLLSPFQNKQTAWMVVSEDKKKAIVGFYCLKANVCALPGFLRLAGLDPDMKYQMEGKTYYGDELMNIGIMLAEFYKSDFSISEDYASFVTVIKAD